jgi:uncharacterized membrane protein
MQNKTLENLIWSLIYAGLAILGFGIWSMEHSLAVGWTVLLSGGALILAGAFGIWVRSRRP